MESHPDGLQAHEGAAPPRRVTVAADVDRFATMVSAAALRADEADILLDFLIALSDLWMRLGFRDPFIDGQLDDRPRWAALMQAARRDLVAQPRVAEDVAFFALRTLSAMQTFVEAWRERPELRAAWLKQELRES